MSNPLSKVMDGQLVFYATTQQEAKYLVVASFAFLVYDMGE